MGAAIAFTRDDWADLTRQLSEPRETALVLLAGSTGRDGGEPVLFVRSTLPVPEEHYLERGPYGLSIGSLGYARSLKAAESDGAVPIFVHTHPGGSSAPSAADERVDELLRPVFTLRSGQPLYASLVVGGTEERPYGELRVWDADGRRADSQRVRVVGKRLSFPGEGADSESSGMFDRQVRAFGVGGQALLRTLHIGVVGAGGTGSSVCEQLIRLGVGQITVIDPDVVAETNVSRIYGSSRARVGEPKVDSIARLAQTVGSGTQVVPLRARVTEESAARALLSCDALFGCTDDHAGRGVLSRLAYWCLMPLFDTGVLISSQDGRITDITGRVTTVMPGTACLVCRGRIDPNRAREEAMDPSERKRLAAEGYAPGLGMPDPSVITFTTMTATFAVNELLDRMIGYGPALPPSETLIRVHEREVRGNTVAPNPGHYCVDRMNWGRGDAAPFLGRLWS